MNEMDRERRALELFEQMLEIAEERRDAWLDEQAGDDNILRARVEAMRLADQATRLRTGGAVGEAEQVPAPERVGAYRIVGLIGHGGMGSVYRAERDAGDFAHLAAIKLIKPGLLSDSLIDRFRAERQTLATLRHPNIAQLYDGGETDDGTPYIIMEYIAGEPLLRWMDSHDADRETRCRLFADACAAVAFANRNLIVHRDLTPSNILVTDDGVVKLIDFGIARPVDADSGAGDRPPSIASLSLTPGYAAPERMLSSEVTTAADVYSLGKLLEKILPPADDDSDLKAIIAQATATQPGDRYASADMLADDVEAWRTGFPVRAVPHSRAYLVRRFVGRNRWGVAAAAAFVLLLSGALVVSLIALNRAQVARAAEAERFDELRSLARFMVFDLEGQMAQVVGNADARLQLANRANEYLTALAATRDAPDDLRLEAAQGLVALARVQGVPSQPNLGQGDQARANLASARRLAESLPVAMTGAAEARAETLASLAMIQAHTDSDVAAATATVGQAQAALDGVPAGARSASWYEARRSVRKAALELTPLTNAAEEMARQADRLEADIADWPADMQNGRAAAMDRATADHYRGLSAYQRDQLAEAVTLLTRAEGRFAELERATPNDPRLLYARMWNAYFGYGATSGMEGRNREMWRFLTLAQNSVDRLIGIEPRDNSLRSFQGNVRSARAQALALDGRYGEAKAVIAEHIAALTQAARGARASAALNRLVVAHVVRGNIARESGDRAMACASYEEGVQIIDRLRTGNELLGFVGDFREGLAANAGRCRAGAPLSALAVLE